MKERLLTWLNILGEKWKNFTKFQKIRVGAIAGVVVLALGLSLFFAFRANWVPIMDDFPDRSQVRPMQDLLEENEIRSRFRNATGALYVDAANADNALLILAGFDHFAVGRFVFQDMLDASGMGVTNSVQHEMNVAVLSGRIEGMITMADHIMRASVILNVANESNFFLQATRPNTATVTLTGHRELTPADGEAAARMVANAVDRMSPENVEVFDSNLNMLWGSGLVNGSDPAAEHLAIMAIENQTTAIVESRARRSIAQLFDFVDATASLVFNREQTSIVAREHRNPLGEGTSVGLFNHIIEQHREGTADGTAALGEVGFGANDGVPGAMIGGGPGDATIEESFIEHDFLHNLFITETVIDNTGQPVLGASRMGVTAGRIQVYRQDVMTDLGYFDDDMTWERFKHENAADRFLYGPEIEQMRYLLIAATGVENLIFVAIERPFFIDMDPPPPFDIWIWLLFALAMLMVIALAFFLIRRPIPEVVTEVEPELSVEDLLVSSQLEEEKVEEMERLAEIRMSGDSEVKSQIDKFTEEKPEAVAQLLRNWINEDWE